jgi:hypothetical protein
MKHYSKKMIEGDDKQVHNEKLKKQSMKSILHSKDKKINQSSSSRVITEKSIMTEMNSTRTLKESSFKTEGISEPPSKSIILSRQINNSRLPLNSRKFVQKMDLRAQFESPILSNKRFGDQNNIKNAKFQKNIEKRIEKNIEKNIKNNLITNKKESVIPEKIVVSQVMTSNNKAISNTSEVISKEQKKDNMQRKSFGRQDIKYRGPVIRSRSKSSRISQNILKRSGITQDSRFSPKPNPETKPSRSNIFTEPLSKSIRIERPTHNTRHSKRTQESQRESEGSNNYKRNGKLKDTLFTQPIKESQTGSHTSPFPSQMNNSIVPRRSEEPISYCSIRTQEKYNMKNSTTLSNRRKSPVSISNNSPLPKCSIRISRSPSPNVCTSKTVVIEENRFGLKIRRKSTEPVKPPHARKIPGFVKGISRFKSPEQGGLFTFDKNLMSKSKNDVSQNNISKSKWYQDSKIQVAESKIVNERNHFKRIQNSDINTPSKYMEISGVTDKSNNEYRSKQIQNKISKISDNISSEMSYIVNTKHTLLSDKHTSEKNVYIKKEITQSQVKTNKNKLSALLKRSPSPRIIRKTITPRQSQPFNNPPKNYIRNAPPRSFNCQTFKPIIIDQSSQLKLNNNSQIHKSFQGWHEIEQSTSLRENRFKIPTREIQSLHRNESPFRTRKTKVIRIEHSRSVDRVSNSSNINTSTFDNQSGFSSNYRKKEIQSNHQSSRIVNNHQRINSNNYDGNSRQNIIVTKPRSKSPNTISANSYSRREIHKTTHNQIIRGPKVNSRFDKSRDILAKKQEMFKDSKKSDVNLKTSRFVESKGKKQSKTGILSDNNPVIYEPSKKLGLSGMKSSCDGVNYVMYNTPSFDNVKFESNLSRLSKLSKKDYNSKRTSGS